MLVNLDKQPTFVHLPDGNQIDFTYDSAGRLSTTVYPSVNGNVTVTRAYDPTTGKLASVSTSDGQTVSYGYDGRLLTSTSWTGNVAGTVGKTYNNDFRVTSETVNGANSISFGYDNEGLLTSIDGLTVVRDSTNGLITSTALGQVTDYRTYESFGKLSTYEAKFGSTSLYSVSYVPDNLGRIEQKTETIQGTTTVWNYSYDSAGRLWQVIQNGVLKATYGYDPNGNRNSVATPSGTKTATYDDQDRLLTYGSLLYTYTPNGDLFTKTDTATGQVTTYSHDALGGLRKVTLPDGRIIEYVLDGWNRRVAKKIDGVVSRKWLYHNSLRPAAELDGAGTVVSRYLPGGLVTQGATYRMIFDSLGSARLVVNSATGEVIQRLDFDEWGEAVADSNPGYQVLGYAGGIFDPDTGLVRFGVRDYDPVAGRWLSKDPRRFTVDKPNLYAYANSDPINSIDPTGLDTMDWVMCGMCQGIGTIATAACINAAKATGAGVLVCGLIVIETRAVCLKPCNPVWNDVKGFFTPAAPAPGTPPAPADPGGDEPGGVCPSAPPPDTCGQPERPGSGSPEDSSGEC